MAKMFYTLEETAEKLGLSDEQVKGLASEGKLQQFRDRDKLMFKREQVDLLAGDAPRAAARLAEAAGAHAGRAFEPRVARRRDRSCRLCADRLWPFGAAADRGSAIMGSAPCHRDQRRQRQRGIVCRRRFRVHDSSGRQRSPVRDRIRLTQSDPRIAAQELDERLNHVSD